MTPLEPGPTRARRILLGFAVTLAALLYIDRVCISQSQHLIGAELGLSKKQMGLVLTVFGIAYGLFEIPGGWLADRFGPRRVLTAGVSWWSLFTVASGWARGLASLAGCRFLFGLGHPVAGGHSRMCDSRRRSRLLVRTSTSRSTRLDASLLRPAGKRVVPVPRAIHAGFVGVRGRPVSRLCATVARPRRRGGGSGI